MNIETFSAGTDLVVIGTNPEMADYDNPRGEIIGHAAYVYAEDAKGNRRRMHVKTARYEVDALQPAVNQANALLARLARGLQPIAFDRWEHFRAAYGSEAYDPSETLEWEHRIDDEESSYA